jgi:putative ABC transport system substrate-binding protein
MNRREFITLFSGAAASAWPRIASAQQPRIGPLVGVLSPLSAATAARNISTFRSALRDVGYVEGRNLTVAYRYGDGVPARMASLARELVALNPDVILAGAQSGALAAYSTTQTIPIVAITPEDPVAAGLAKSIARPGGNVTGTWSQGDDTLVGKRLDFLKLAVPGLARIGALFNPTDPTDHVAMSKLEAASRPLGLIVKLIEVRDTNTLASVADEITRAGTQGLLVGQSPLFNSARMRVAAMVASLKLPAMYGWREFADAGGLMCYGPNLSDIYRQSGRLAGRILKGEKPGDLPFEVPTRYELIVNLKTARAMGLELPPTFVLLADEVIE